MAFNPFTALGKLFNTHPDAVNAVLAEEDDSPVLGGGNFIKESVLRVPAPVAGPSEDEIRAKVTAEIQVAEAKKTADSISAFYKSQADEFTASLVKAGKLDPKDAPALAARYVDAATLDGSAPLSLIFADGTPAKLSRLDLVRDMAQAQPKARWTEDTIGADKTEFKGSFADCKILASAASPDEEAAAKVAARHLEMLANSPAGQAHLASIKK